MDQQQPKLMESAIAAEKNGGDKPIEQEGDIGTGTDKDIILRRLFGEYSKLDRSAYDAQVEVLMKVSFHK